VGISAHRNGVLAEKIIREFSVSHVATGPHLPSRDWREKFPGIKFCSPEELVALEGVDRVILALPGLAALRPLLAAIRANKTIALANKESVVAAGHLIHRELEASGAKILPVDSEANGIFRCVESSLAGIFRRVETVRKVWLTASGGPFFGFTGDQLARVTVDDALRHPLWSMGRKITVDSATLANKALEEVEASWLYGLAAEQLEVVIHREGLIHALVEFCDGSTLAAMHPPSMEFPLAHCLHHPEKKICALPAIDFLRIPPLSFAPPDRENFPCLALGESAMRAGQSGPCDFNAADEAAVLAFLDQRISFSRIPGVIERVLERMDRVELPSLEAVEARQEEICRRVREWVGGNP
jgi:1-deoxy-D-xylulose-5-phosphate reductoisomerase